MFYKNKDARQIVFKNKKWKICLDELFLKIIFSFLKNIVNSIHKILIKFNSSLIENENNCVITNKF